MKMRKLPTGKIELIDAKGNVVTYDTLHEAMAAVQKGGAMVDLEELLDEVRSLTSALEQAADENGKLARACTRVRNENAELRAKNAKLESVVVDQAMRLAGVVK